MTKIGAYEAKTHLPGLLERVEKGERFTITRHGRPVAELIPASRRDVAGIRKAIGEVRRVRETLGRRGVRLRKLLQRGETLRSLAHSDHRY